MIALVVIGFWLSVLLLVDVSNNDPDWWRKWDGR